MVAVSLKKIFFKQKTAYEITDCDWSSDVCSSDLAQRKVTWAQVMLGGLAAVSLVLFGVYFPVISGLPVSREYVNSLELLGTWYFG